MEYDMVAALPKPPGLFDRVDEWALFSRAGFRDELLAAGSSDDIALVTLADMYAK
jgi:hypothetical protein